jgi:transport family protein 27
VAIVGDATVGKTALLQVLKSNGHEYPKNYVMVRLQLASCELLVASIHPHDGVCSSQTSDVELSTKSIAIPDTNVVVELYLFDCAGQSIFNQLDFGTVHVRRIVFLVAMCHRERDLLLGLGVSTKEHRWLWSCSM